MFLNFHLSRIAPDFRFKILGTDVDPESVEIARNGVYAWNEIKEAPYQYIHGHWSRGSGEISRFVKAKDALRSPCSFTTGNLLSLTMPLQTEAPYHIVFCRNVFIYFSPQQIAQATRGILARMHAEAYLFVGISETLAGLDLPLQSSAPSVYTQTGRRNKSASVLQMPTRAPQPPVAHSSSPVQVPVPPATNPIVPPPVNVVSSRLRVLCVDDSPTVLTLLKRILVPEEGFEVVATAANGLEANEKLRKHKIDVMTLDIHMPKQTGLEYLRASYRAGHVPVVMVSSVAREDAGLALECLEAGASDYVEKPEIANLIERGDEIRAKLACAAHLRGANLNSSEPKIERAFAKSPASPAPDGSLRIIIASVGDRLRVAELLKSLPAPHPSTWILMEGANSMLESVAREISAKSLVTVQASQSSITGQASLLDRGVRIADLKTALPQLARANKQGKSSVLALGAPSDHAIRSLKEGVWTQILFEDIALNKNKLHKTDGSAGSLRHDLVPVTSFAYMSAECLGRKDV
jgi:chemotaxis protein methyltransferase CheR